MTSLTRLRLILVDLSGLMKKKTYLKQNILFVNPFPSDLSSLKKTHFFTVKAVFWVLCCQMPLNFATKAFSYNLARFWASFCCKLYNILISRMRISQNLQNSHLVISISMYLHSSFKCIMGGQYAWLPTIVLTNKRHQYWRSIYVDNVVVLFLFFYFNMI